MEGHSRDFHLSSNTNIDFTLLLYHIKYFSFIYQIPESYFHETSAKVIYTFKLEVYHYNLDVLYTFPILDVFSRS